jgi:multidrug efflux pump subunit AcrA (membrane-fusion protein)
MANGKPPDIVLVVDDSRQATLDQNKRDLARSKALTSVIVTAQKVEQDQETVDVTQAALDQANANLGVAKLNLERSTVTALVNGIVTNFGLLPGAYVTAGAPILALIDSDTPGRRLLRRNEVARCAPRRQSDGTLAGGSSNPVRARR